MRLEGVRVDGYGLLSDFSVDDLGHELVVFFGPNEAGKSTLLDFVRGVLFGFPDGRHRAPRHEPLRGGRHGGALRLLDKKTTVLIERHSDRREPVVTIDGAAASPGALRHVLGAADANLFRSVFAFGLSELSSFESLDNDEVRDLLFSAGVRGAGRSATAAMRELDARRSEIVRQRQKDATANRLRQELETLDRSLREARAASLSYRDQRRELELVARQLEEERERVRRLEGRQSELSLLLTCWPFWRSGADAERALAGLAPIDEPTSALLAHEAEITSLGAELSGHEERLERRRDLDQSLRAIESKLDALVPLLESLGDPVQLVRAEPLFEERASFVELDEDHKKMLWELDELETNRRGAKEELDDLTVPDDRGGDKDAGPDALESAKRLERDLAELARLEERGRSEERERRFEALARPARTTTRSRVISISSTAVAGLALAIGGLFTSDKALGAAGIILLVLAGVVSVLSLRPSSGHSGGGGGQPSPGEDAGLARLRAETEELCHRLGFSERPTPGALGARLDELEDQQVARARRLEAAKRLGRLETQLTEGKGRLGKIERRAGELAKRIGVSTPLSPRELLGAFDAVVEARELTAARGRVAEELGGLEDLTERFEASLAALYRAVDPSGQLGSSEGPAAALSALAGALERARERNRDEEDLRDKVEAARSDLEESLGSGARAEHLRQALSSGEVLSWRQEQEGLKGELDEAKERRDELAKCHSEAERELAGLAGSGEVARLELEREVVSASLDEALSRWLTLGLARSLLDRTLGRYERERQPEVIARAAELFEEITDGRYVELIPHEDEGRRTIFALSSKGERIESTELSRGTAEQLYLCLRLGFATTFASTSLPLVLDDVLVNFDPARQAGVARVLATVARTHQVLALTCHPQVLEALKGPCRDLRVVELPGSRRP